MPPTKKPRRAIALQLEKLYGRGSDRLLEQLDRIAFGKLISVETIIEGTVRELSPTISEMHAAIMDLLAYQHGRPRQGLDVEVTDERQTLDYDRLSTGELEEMLRLADKVTPKIVEGQFTVEPVTPEEPKK